jgi:hypothetical protein
LKWLKNCSFSHQNVILAQIKIQQFQENANPGSATPEKEILRIVGLQQKISSVLEPNMPR